MVLGKPNYNVISYVDSKHAVQIGVAWLKKTGNIAVRLNSLPFTKDIILVRAKGRSSGIEPGLLDVEALMQEDEEREEAEAQDKK